MTHSVSQSICAWMQSLALQVKSSAWRYGIKFMNGEKLSQSPKALQPITRLRIVLQDTCSSLGISLSSIKLRHRPYPSPKCFRRDSCWISLARSEAFWTGIRTPLSFSTEKQFPRVNCGWGNIWKSGLSSSALDKCQGLSSLVNYGQSAPWV